MPLVSPQVTICKHFLQLDFLMDEIKLRGIEKQYKLRVKTGCETCRCVTVLLGVTASVLRSVLLY